MKLSSMCLVFVMTLVTAACGSHNPSPASPAPAASAAGSSSTAATPAAGGSACEAAGGKCVALTPTSCPDGTVGDAAKYSCGGGLGVECCLPKQP